jgi:putative ABC transport system permease protein
MNMRILRNFEMEKGRYFSPYESKNGRNAVILGNDIATQLFGTIDPLGREVVISGYKLTVIGVIKKEGAGGLGDSGMDKAVVVPVGFVRNILNIRDDRLNPNIMVKAAPGVSMMELEDDLRYIIRSFRRLKPTAPDNFSLNRASMISQGFEGVFAGINLGGWIIGGFSILVGGFGIANIMFVSVKERTHIIGIQKALGAKKNFILLQFLNESVLLSLTGGVLGLLLVFSGTLVVAEFTEFAIRLTAGNIVLGLIVSAVIGIVSGFAPAYAAARLNPVEAISTSF